MTKILVVEDDGVVASLLRHVFERQGFDVEHVADGRQAKRMIDGDPPDVVVLDYMLPHTSGRDVLTAIRESESWKDVPVIFVSARTDQREIADLLASGANDYMTKPFGVEELAIRVRRLIRG